MDLYCPQCSTSVADPLRAYCCPSCSGPLACRQEPASFPKEDLALRPPTPWRYAEALPEWAGELSLGEVLSPLVPFDVDGHSVLLKCDQAQPTGSYKDRGSALLVRFLQQRGVREAVEDSSGNAGASIAAYAAKAGIHLKVFCPASASPAKLAQITRYGAELVRVEGARPKATEALLDHIAQSDAVYASHLWNPLFVYGIQTLAFELVEQLNWQAPDVVFCPVGAGSILLGLYEGFSRMHAAGAINKLPQLVAVQAKHVAPLYAAWLQGGQDVLPFPDPQTTHAEGIALPKPVRGRALLTALRASSGDVIAVEEEEIKQGLEAFGRGGLCTEPTSAVVWQGIRTYCKKHSVEPDKKLVAILSGHGLKGLT